MKVLDDGLPLGDGRVRMLVDGDEQVDARGIIPDVASGGSVICGSHVDQCSRWEGK